MPQRMSQYKLLVGEMGLQANVWARQHTLSERQDVRRHIVIVLLVVVPQYPCVTGSKKSVLTYLH